MMKRARKSRKLKNSNDSVQRNALNQRIDREVNYSELAKHTHSRQKSSNSFELNVDSEMMVSTREEEGNEHVQNANSAFAYRPNEASYSEPITTNSGLLLTHRRPAPVSSASSQSASIAREKPISPSHRRIFESPQNHAPYAFNERGGGSPSNNNRYRNNNNNTTPYYRDPSSPQSNSNPPWQTFSVIQDMRRENRMLRNVRLAVIGLTCMFLFIGFGLIHRHHSNELDRVVNNNYSASTNLQEPDRTESKTIISSQTKSYTESESNTSNNISTPLFQSSEQTPTLTKNNIHQDIAEDVPITRLRPLPVHMQPLGNNDITEIQMPKEELQSPLHEHHRKMKNVKKVDSSNFHFPHLDWNNNNVKNRQEEKRREKEKHDKMNIVGHLREEFEEWIKEHNKSYHSEKEKEKRFKIWSDNHHRTLKKNEAHGPCKLTGKAVFGSTPFKDITPEEFQQNHLTGYKGPKVEKDSTKEEIFGKHYMSTPPKVKPSELHKERKRKLEEMKQGDLSSHAFTSTQSSTNSKSNQQNTGTNNESNNNNNNNKKRNLSRTGWFVWETSIFNRCRGKMSCYLNYLFGSNYGTDTVYEEDTLPDYCDWSLEGAVTSIHSQGVCGGCWAITATETIESANYLYTGELLDLAEAEIIMCDDTCDMCMGGWPQNAYEYAIKHGGLLSEYDCAYDGDTLYTITAVLSGYYEIDDGDAAYVNEYVASMCPDDEGGNKNDDGYSLTRYAKPKGYGYVTDRCLCYSDGSGCDCDEQDEIKALGNIATYGPATMCLDASTWYDYAGGIMTAESGCSAYFLDMNHCVQVVGYAFLEEEEDDTSSGRRLSGSGSRKSNDRVSEKDGYFIVRNEWSDYWGMNGYAYIAMGGENANTCGSLNDITQVYMSG